MLRSRLAVALLAALVVVGGCGGSSKSTSSTIPESKLDPGATPAPAPAPTPPAAETPAAPPAPPPVPAGPITVTVDALHATVKLLKPGQGKRAALRIAPKAASKEQVSLLMDAAIEQTAGGQPGATVTMPTVVLHSSSEVTAVGADGTATYHAVIDSVDATARPNQSVSPEDIKKQIVSLTGMAVDGTVAADGTAGTTNYVIEKPTAETGGAIDSLRLMLPTWVPMPKEAVGVGAQWEVTVPVDINGIATTHVTTYSLVSRTANAITISGETKVQGANQTLQGVEVTDISGDGHVDLTFNPQKLFPSLKRTISTKVHLKQGAEDLVINMHVGSAFEPKK